MPSQIRQRVGSPGSGMPGVKTSNHLSYSVNGSHYDTSSKSKSYGKVWGFSRIKAAAAAAAAAAVCGRKITTTTRYTCRHFVTKYGKYFIVVLCILTIRIFIFSERNSKDKSYQGIARSWSSLRRSGRNTSMTHPMVIGCYFEDYEYSAAKTSSSATSSIASRSKSSKITRIRYLPINDEYRYPSKRQVEWTSHDVDFHKHLLDSKKYNKARADNVGVPTKVKSNGSGSKEVQVVEQLLKGSKDKDKNNFRSKKRGWGKNSDKTNCKLPYEWMVRPHPTCNSIHEHNLNTFFIESSTMAVENVRLIANGFWRDVWKIRDDISSSNTTIASSSTVENEYTAAALTKEDYSSVHIAAKTLRYEHDYTERNLDRHIRDAIAMEQTTSSPNILDMHAYCGHAIFTELADSAPGAAPTVSDMIWPEDDEPCKVPMRERLNVALEVARGVRDFHFAGAGAGADDRTVGNSNGKRYSPATMAHTDVTPSQFVFVNGKIKMNDFNRCRFIARRDNGDVCPFRVSSNPGKFRSPEEYAYEPETEKVDVYSMGNLFYSLLTEIWPNEKMKSKDAQNAVMNNIRPVVPDKVLQMSEAGDLSVQILLTAMQKCWTYKPSKRPSSKEIVAYLELKIKKLGGKPPPLL